MKIGNVAIGGRFILAPMAGVTDKAFRAICREAGADLSVSEMVSTRALQFQDKKSLRLLSLAANETPGSVQIFGHDPDSMAAGARKAAERSGCRIIDINMGCPAPKIVSNGDGSALMRDVRLAASIITAVVNAVSLPVTVKFRTGWDEQHLNYIEFAKMAEDSGAAAVCLHGRTRTQMYSGKADWESIAAVKQAVHIPVIGNGDVFSPEDAARMIETTQADFVMIGRGALGNPWIFSRAKEFLRSGVLPAPPSFAERLATAVRQIELAAAYKGERIAMLEARKHLNWYLKGIPQIKEFKIRISGLTTLQEMYAIREELLYKVQ